MTNQRAIILLSCMYLPFFDDEEKGALTKAIETLSNLEPRIVKPDEIKEGEAYWFSVCTNQKPDSYYAICIHREDDAGWPYISFVSQYGTSSWPIEQCGNGWCCWTSKPN